MRYAAECLPCSKYASRRVENVLENWKTESFGEVICFLCVDICFHNTHDPSGFNGGKGTNWIEIPCMRTNLG